MPSRARPAPTTDVVDAPGVEQLVESRAQITGYRRPAQSIAPRVSARIPAAWPSRFRTGHARM